MKDTVNGFASLLGDLNLRRFLWLIALAAVLAAIALGYERASATVKLRRIERTAEIAMQLHSLDSSRVSSDSMLGQALASLKRDLRAVAVDGGHAPAFSAFLPRSVGTALKRFFSGASLWMLFAVVMSINATRLDEQQMRISAGVSLRPGEKPVRGTKHELERLTNVAGILSLITGFASILMPLYEVWWFLALVHPLLSLFVGLGLSALYDFLYPWKNPDLPVAPAGS